MDEFKGYELGDFINPVQSPGVKVEVEGESGWVDISDYVVSVNISRVKSGLGGEPVAGVFDVELVDVDDEFNPFNTTAAYKDLIRSGRRVRISQYLGTEEWVKIIGFMDEPSFDFGEKKVKISGMDYMKRLIDKVLSGQECRWGDVAIFDSVESPGVSGAEQYEEADCVRIGEAEANSVGDWVNGTTTKWTMSSAAGGNNSNYALKFVSAGTFYFNTNYAENSGVVALDEGVEYVIKFDFKVHKPSTSTEYIGKVQFINEASGEVVDEVELSILTALSDMWQSYSKKIVWTTTGNLKIKISIYGIKQGSSDEFYFDNFSVRLYDNTSWTRYKMPEDCEGVYYVVLDGEPVWQGDEDGSGGWHYNEQTKEFYFSEEMGVEAGSQNLFIYYYKESEILNAVADVLVYCGLYGSRAEALAEMEYDYTDEAVAKLYFDDGISGIEAIRMLCERLDYEFYFTEEGVPVFKKIEESVADVVDVELEAMEVCNSFLISEDSGTIKNKVIIEGSERSVLDVSTGEVKKSNWRYEEADEESVELYGERSYMIRNHLFQDEESMEAVAGEILNRWSERRRFFTFGVPVCVLPVQLGDVLGMKIKMAGGLEREIKMRVREVNISGVDLMIKAEEVYEAEVESEDLEVGVSMEEAVVTGLNEVMVNGEAVSVAIGEAGLTISEEYIYTTTQDGVEVDVPSWATSAVVECWGSGGMGGGGDVGMRGGGGGGGAYARKTISVASGDKLKLFLYQSTDYLDTWVEKSGSVICKAKRGGDGYEGAAGVGGAAASCVGDIKYNGGNGYYYPTGTTGGGGGGSAGVSGAGNSATSRLGASAVSGGGAGGNGGYAGNDGSNGGSPGGGGGGAGEDYATPKVGGEGGIGKIKITYQG